MKYNSKYCITCGGIRRVSKPGPNHIFHLLLTILTMGWWALVWVGCCISIGGWRCTTCGSTNLRRKNMKYKLKREF